MKYRLLLLVSLFVSCASCQKQSQSPDASSGGDPTPTPTPTPASGRDSVKATYTIIAGRMGQSAAVDGQGGNAAFINPYKLCFDSRNNKLYVADNNLIRVIDQQNNVSTLLGNGVLNNFEEIYDIDLAPGAAGSLYFTTKYYALYKIDGATNQLTILTKGEGNDDGPLAANNHLDGAYGVAPGSNDDIAVYNTYWNSLKRVRTSGANAGTMEAWAGKPTEKIFGGAWPFADGQGLDATFSSHIYDISSDGLGNIYMADKDNARVRKVSPAGAVSSIDPTASWDNNVLAARIKANGVECTTANQDGSYLYFTAPVGPYGNSGPLIRLCKQGKGIVWLSLSDNNPNRNPADDMFGHVSGMAVTPDGKTLYIAEEFNKVISKITLQ
ncbi:MAG TPA: hypothetical protein VHE34_24855 [Puia sp.]|uniref:hypothetical protein n=1 Tax=Puia sp. TaxID=2045100 RepID=UPI002C19F8F9|nr:hypothetical protein [Puia sp.]HVU98487.1 hypothetical protein [Puia sp.]